MEMSVETLVEVDDIGERIAESVVAFFHSEDNSHIIERLKNYGLQMKVSEATMAKQSDKLKGKTIVISGVFEKSRKELKQLIEDHGGKNTGSLSKNTDYLLAGENMGPSKKKKAEKLGTPLLSEGEFLKMLS